MTALTTYLIAITLLTITPGVDTMLVIRNTARGGWRDGAVSSLGICSALFLHATISAVGISVILLQAAWAFSLLKMAGAGYLIWLGLSSWLKILKQEKFEIVNGTPSEDGHFLHGFSAPVYQPCPVGNPAVALSCRFALCHRHDLAVSARPDGQTTQDLVAAAESQPGF
jgi:threonine/homoserine/homoserine lactone efflux protein